MQLLPCTPCSRPLTRTPSPTFERLKRLHKIAGYLYVALFVFISYLCIGFVAASRNDPSPRAALHIVLALSIAALFLLKVMYVRFFRQFYSQAKTIGILIGILSFVLVGLTGGFYLVTSSFGRDLSVDKSVYYELKGPFLIVKEIERPGIMAIRTDRFSIERGRTLFVSKCAICHDPNSTRTIIGPGLKGILKRPTLPISGRAGDSRKHSLSAQTTHGPHAVLCLFIRGTSRRPSRLSEYAVRCVCVRGGSYSEGIVKLNVEPLPGSDSTQMRPPCLSTIFLQMASPIPVPL